MCLRLLSRPSRRKAIPFERLGCRRQLVGHRPQPDPRSQPADRRNTCHGHGDERPSLYPWCSLQLSKEKSQMRRFGKWFLIALGSLVVLLAIVITLTIGWRPFFGPKARALTNRTFERTQQRLERGRYIATGLSSCVYCHSPHDWTSPGTPIVAGKEVSGEVLPYADLPGRIVASNLTPDPETGAGSWTDDQLARAIREGVGHDGRALFPIMPYQRYRNMSDEDLASVVVYLRSLAEVRNP